MEFALYQNYVTGGILALGCIILMIELIKKIDFRKEMTPTEIQVKGILDKLKTLN